MASTASSRLLASGGASPPGTPTSFSASASTTTPKAINLSWASPSTSPPIPLTGYKLYRGGTLIATQSGTTFVDTGLAYGTAYSYTVYAYNPSGDSITPASASATTAVACSNAQSSIVGGSTSVTVPAGCFKVRIRALSGGGGGWFYDYDVHLGSCRGYWSGGGGGAYINGLVSVTPLTSITLYGGSGGGATTAGGSAGFPPYCSVSGGLSTNAQSTNSGGSVEYNTVGATVNIGGSSGTAGGGSNVAAGGPAALAGTNPTGLYTHGSFKNQTCGSCSGCTGSTGNSYGGGGSGGTDSGALYGETAYPGGSGASGYCVWTFSES